LKKAQEPSANTATLEVSSFGTCDSGDIMANDEETPLEFGVSYSDERVDVSTPAGADGDLVNSAALFLTER
jgi:hypothetical protein